MKKEITIYELARLSKNDKAPKRIKFNGDKYYLEDCGNYVRYDGSLYIILDGGHPILTCSNDKVEIIEEPKELEEITLEFSGTQKEKNKLFKDTINEIIRYIKDKENK